MAVKWTGGKKKYDSQNGPTTQIFGRRIKSREISIKAKKIIVTK